MKYSALTEFAGYFYNENEYLSLQKKSKFGTAVCNEAEDEYFVTYSNEAIAFSDLFFQSELFKLIDKENKEKRKKNRARFPLQIAQMREEEIARLFCFFLGENKVRKGNFFPLIGMESGIFFKTLIRLKEIDIECSRYD